jgi:hypothetical protein
MTRLWTIGTRPERGLDSYAKPCNLESKKPPVGVVAASNPHRPERSKMTLQPQLERLRQRIFPLARLVHAFAASLTPPTMDRREVGFRYARPDHRHFCLLRAARVVSGLNASIVLAQGSYPQEIGVLGRTVHEFMRQMEAVATQVEQDGRVSGQLADFIDAYFADDKRGHGPQKRATLSEKYVNELLGASLDEFADRSAADWSSAADKLHNISFVRANYVHGRYPESMDLCGGYSGHFHISGMSGTPKDAENIELVDALITSASLCFVHLVHALDLRSLLARDPMLVDWYNAHINRTGSSNATADPAR